MASYSEIIASLQDAGGSFTVAPDDDWRQGRTLYGGLSAALAVEAARRAFPDLPPLRSAQFAFAGPAVGALDIVPTMLRAGRSAAFVSVLVTAEAGIATQATLCFGAARPSAYDYRDLAMPAVPPPDRCEGFFRDDFAPRFTCQFDGRLAGAAPAVSGADRPDLLLWLCHRDRNAADDATSVVALADALPPGAMAMFTSPAPISTMTWSLDLLTDRFDGAGWYLARTLGEVIGDGYSSQAMTLWDEGGRPVAAARQSVALYA